MNNKSSISAAEPILNPPPHPTEEEQFSLEELIKSDDTSSHQLQKYKNKIHKTLIKDRVAAGMPEHLAVTEVENLFLALLAKKQSEEAYIRGEFNLDFLKVIIEDPFLGTLSMQVSKIADSKAPTAYVGVRPYGKDYDIVMGFNPKWFRSLSLDHRQGVIKHEMYHLIFQHIFSRAVGDREYAYLQNIAQDMAINSIIGAEKLPDICIIPGKMAINPKTKKPLTDPYSKYIASAEPMKSSEFYFEELRKIYEQEKQKGNDNTIQIAIDGGLGTMDSHELWDDLPEEIKEQIKDKVNGMLEKAVKNAERTNDWGSVPTEIQEVIRKLLSKEVDWRSVVKNFVGRCRTMDRISTIRRINKKNPYNFPGVKRKYVANFIIFGDQSGSMSNEDVARLFSELESLSKETSFDYYAFDTEVDINSHQKWKRRQPHPTLKRSRCGGTDFSCIADFLNKKENKGKYSGCIILTDGYAPKLPQILGTKVLWVITEGGTTEAVRPSDLVCKMGSGERKFKSY